jgi:hypothetical protein
MEDSSFHFYRGDDGFEKPRNSHHASRPRKGEPPIFSYLNPHNFGILVAILVIYFFQRKGRSECPDEVNEPFLAPN